MYEPLTEDEGLVTLCQRFRATLGLIHGIPLAADRPHTIGLSVVAHLEAQLTQYFPDSSVQERRSYAVIILDSVASALRATRFPP